MTIKVRQKKRPAKRTAELPRAGTRLKLIAVFQLLLWWGAEVIQSALRYRPARGKIVRIEEASCPFPRSSWVLTKDGAYCLIDRSETHSVEIHRGAPFSLN